MAVDTILKHLTAPNMHVYVDREDKPMRLVFGVLLRGAPSSDTTLCGLAVLTDEHLR